MLLHFFKDNYTENAFLPPYSDESHGDWQKYFLSTSIMKSESEKEPELSWMSPDIITVKSEDMKKLQFLSKRWKSVSLSDPTLIHICLRLTNEDIFATDSMTILQQLSAEKADINTETLEIEKLGNFIFNLFLKYHSFSQCRR